MVLITYDTFEIDREREFGIEHYRTRDQLLKDSEPDSRYSCLCLREGLTLEIVSL